MLRRVAWILLPLLAAPTAGWLGPASGAKACRMVCHTASSGGAACCRLSRASGTAADLLGCAAESAGLVSPSLRLGRTMSAARFAPPESRSRRDPGFRLATSAGCARLPDHVPLSLS